MRFYPGVSIITLGVGDIGRAREFYTRLGWRRSEAASNDRICFFALNNVVLALFGRSELAADSGLDANDASPHSGGFSRLTLAQNYGSEAGVREALEEAAAAGGRVLVDPSSTGWGGFHAVFADPDGHVWELAYNPWFALNADGTVELPS